MKVILLQDVENFGKVGDIKVVRTGYGFNFLLPQGLAEFATPVAIKQLEKMMTRRLKEVDTETESFKVKAAELTGKKVTIKSKAEKDKLFGSVGREEVMAALQEAGVAVDAKILAIEKPFKEVGTFPVVADFGHGVKTTFEVVIEAE